MSGREHGLRHHPAPQGDRLSTPMAAFMLLTGPLAWFVQLCVGDMLTGWSCYPGDIRLFAPLNGYGWTYPAAVAILLACAALAALSGWVSWRKLQEVRHEREGGHRDLIHIGHGRTRFIALWSTIFGSCFAIAALVTLAAFALVPPCLG